MSGAALLAPARAGRRYTAAVRALASVQKPGAGFPAYTRWVNRRLARYAAAAAYRLGWTPNAVTTASAACSAIAVGLVATAPAVGAVAVAAAVLFALGYLLDSADGQLARLTGTGSPAGEWLDHVVDAIRTPAVHLAVLVGLHRALPGQPWAQAVAIAFCVVAVGQFMSQILAEQLSGRTHRAIPGRGVRPSLLTLPTDTGVLCWLFLLWGAPLAFAIAYAALFAANAAHAAVSMRRKHGHLRSLGAQS